MQQLVPGRVCGDCNACCSNYTVSLHGKTAPTLCPHWQGGCSIYEDRPEPCRTFYCLWRKAAELDDDWRPDRSGVILRGEDGALTLDIMDPDVITHDRVVALVMERIDQGVPVTLGAAGKKGFGRVLLNDRMQQTLGNRPAMVAALKAALADALAAAN